MKKDKISDTLVVIDNYNFCDIQTHRHVDSMTDPARKAESVKSRADYRVIISIAYIAL